MDSQNQPNPSRHVYILGQLHVQNDREVLALRGSKVRSLFAYLILNPRRQHGREQLADMLWPRAPHDRVRRNLSDTIYRLRQALGSGWLAVNRDAVRLNVTPDLWVDVWAFKKLVESNQPDYLKEAVELYHGDLLPEIYDDWILEPRLALREMYLNALLRLAQAAEQQHDPAAAHSYYHRLAHADPLREEAHRGLMRSLANMDRLADALNVYGALKQQLADELGVSPVAETQTLAAQLESELALTQKAADLTEERLVQRPFAGRIQERSAIFSAVEAAVQGQGGLLAIEGDVGIGKSRLLQEIESGADWRNVTVVKGYTTEYPAASPFAPLAGALTAALAPPRAAQLETLLPAESLAAAAPLFPPWHDQAVLPELPMGRTRDRFHQALAAVCHALATLSPHLIILDDLHWADAALWAALDALASSLTQHRLLILLAYRRPGIEQSPGWATLQQWQRVGQIKILPLRPLNSEEVAQLLPSAMQDEAAPVLASTGGNPFYISEMLIALAEGHAPYGQTAVTRAHALPDPAREALEAAAVIGSEVSFRLWAGVTGLAPAELAPMGDQLTAHYLLNPAAAGYAFPHDLIHEAIYESIEPARRRRLHQLTADTLAGQSPDNLRARAFHLDRAEAGMEAAAIYLQVGEQDMARFAFASAQDAFDRALALMSAHPTPERIEALLSLIEACSVTGDRERERAALDEALNGVHSLRDPALHIRVLLLDAQISSNTSQHEVAAQRLSQALLLAEQTNNREAQLQARQLSGDLATRTGEYDLARTHFEAAIRLAHELNNQQQEGRALDGLGFVLMNSGKDSVVAIRYFHDALALQRTIGDRFGAARSLVNLLSAYQNTGAWDKVLELAEEAYAAQEAVSYRQGMAAVRQAQGLAACMLGDFDAAHQFITQARDSFAAARDEIGIGIATDALGLVAERQGRHDEAAAYFRQALTIAEEANARTFAAFAQQDLGILCSQIGKPDDAIPLLESAIAAWRQQGDELNSLKCEACLALSQLEKGQQDQAAALAESGWRTFQDHIPNGEEPQGWLWAMHRLMASLNCTRQADEILDAAYQELQRQARAISDHAMRRRFFTRVPANRAIVEAYDRRHNITRHIHVTLARSDAPLGRPLTGEEKVNVKWTITAPEDEAISQKSELRRVRLQRLLAEAEAHGAAPTDADLAQALGVSRRTILRDMDALRQSDVPLPTRRRPD